jgi:hypothetical protein
MIPSIGPIARPRHRVFAFLAGSLLLAGQAAPPRYSQQILGCAAFQEQVRSEIRTQSGGVLREEHAGRDGILVLRSTYHGDTLLVEAWYDTLSLWREGPEGRVTPDTDGLLGGRWRGVLSGTGQFTGLATPFIPDEVAEIAELRGVLNDFLPPLPATPLSDGQSHVWTKSAATDTVALFQDWLEVPMHQTSKERSSLVWDSRRGPVRWERTLTLTVRVASLGAVRRGRTSVITQQIRVSRLDLADACR